MCAIGGDADFDAWRSPLKSDELELAGIGEGGCMALIGIVVAEGEPPG